MAINNGGPAFPVDYDHGTFKPSHVDEAKRLMSGMSLRDYFAAKALQGLIASWGQHDVTEFSALAADAYFAADAMLKAREVQS